MKKVIRYIFMTTVIALGLTSCNDDTSPVLDYTRAPEIAPLESPVIILNEASESFIAETFAWTKGEYGFQAAPLYVLQLDNDKSFPDPVTLAESNKDYATVTVGKLNTAATILGGEPGTPIEVYARLQAKLTNNVVMYSDATDLLVTTYPTVVDYPKLYVPGSYQGWDIANAPTLTSWRMNNKYEGYINFVNSSDPTAAITFKLTTKPAWGQGNEYGSGGAPGTLELKGGDISISPQGLYHLIVDLNTLTYTATPSTGPTE
ncbi:SusE domain-containing protein [Coprobacter tertius]|uniref:SusE domain-containing protein n=1 Tax=Coprobacter tertius TaxID=2944915 RepID=A0ABT1MI73_9BACT|nr:SusE domain-containing protein [Coprobacter tertius]MCP9612333.1 SusE domain-containing protein [Coprobacter tertius]